MHFLSLSNVAEYSSEHIFQSKLHDPRIERGCDLTERSASERRIRILHPEGIRDIEHLYAKFQSLCFPDLERSGDRCIELPGTWAFHAAWAHVPECPERGLRE